MVNQCCQKKKHSLPACLYLSNTLRHGFFSKKNEILIKAICIDCACLPLKKQIKFSLKNNLRLSLFKIKIGEALQKKSHFLMQIPLDTLENSLEANSWWNSKDRNWEKWKQLWKGRLWKQRQMSVLKKYFCYADSNNIVRLVSHGKQENNRTRELSQEMDGAHTLHYPSPSDGPDDLGWPAEEEPSPSEGQAEQPHGSTKLL